jgi:hypothetical protein
MSLLGENRSDAGNAAKQVLEDLLAGRVVKLDRFGGKVRELASTVLDLVREDETVATRLETLAGSHPELMAAFSWALTGPDSNLEHDEEDREMLGRLESLQAEGDQAVGFAFGQRLMPHLPAPLGDLEACFRSVSPLTNQQVHQVLFNSPACRAAGEDLVRPLVVRGLTPISIFEASEAVPALIRRLQRQGRLVAEKEIELTDRPSDFPNSLSLDLVRQEIGHATRSLRETSEAILRWMLNVARERPHLFGGLIAKPTDDGPIRLSPSTEIPRGREFLGERWAFRG